jgi:hypothetical protein
MIHKRTLELLLLVFSLLLSTLIVHIPKAQASSQTSWSALLPYEDARLNQTLTTYKHDTYAEATLSANLWEIDKDKPETGKYEVPIVVVAAANTRYKLGYNTRTGSGAIYPPTLPKTLTLGDNEGAWVSFDSGDAITFYGATYNKLFVTSNGLIILDPRAENGGVWTSPYPVSIPSTQGPNALIAPFWRDLDPTQGGSIKYGYKVDNYFVVAWTDIHDKYGNHCSFSVEFDTTFTVGFGFSGYIRFSYYGITTGIPTSIGIEDQYGKRGVSVASVSSGQWITFNHNYPDNAFGATSIKISASKHTDSGVNDDKAWIDITGTNNTVPGGVNVELADPSDEQYSGDHLGGAASFVLGGLGLLKGFGWLGVVGFALDALELMRELSPTPESSVHIADVYTETAYTFNVALDEKIGLNPPDVSVGALFRWILNDPSVAHRLVLNAQIDYATQDGYFRYSLLTDNLELRLAPGNESWYGRTNPDAHYYNFYQISTYYGTSYHIDTAGSYDYNYQMLGWSKLTANTPEDYKVGADGKIRVGGYFRQSDTFDSYLQPGRRLMNIYVMYSENINSIVKTVQVLDYTDGIDWTYKGMIIDGLSPGKSVKVGVGRSDAWSTDWQLAAEWAGVEVGQGAGSPPLKPPNPPSGQTVVQRNVWYTYSTQTADPDGDRIRYEFEFSGPIPTVSFKTGWYASNQIGDLTVMWEPADPLGTYYVRTRAQDYYGQWGDWSQPLTVTLVETIPNLRFSLREHGVYLTRYSPDISFLKPSSGVLRVDSYQSGARSMGNGWAFVVVPRDWLNGKYIRFSWSGYFSFSQARVFGGAYIYDGEYDRTNDLDFPDGQAIPLKGAGLLQTISQKNTYGYWGPETIDVLVNVAAGTQSKCTIFFLTGDAWVQQKVYFDVDWFEINQGAGGVSKLAIENFDASVTMERTGTYKDYGYISSGYIP